MVLAPSTHDLGREVSTKGLVILRGLTSAAAREIAAELGNMHVHRDADHDGVTVIHADPLRADLPISAAFTTAALPPHTDGSGVARPADIVVTYVDRAARTGGHATFVDGQELIATLLREAPRVLSELSRRDALLFGADNLPAPTFEKRGDRVRIRYREDGCTRAESESAARALAYMRRLAGTMMRTIEMGQGDLYVVDNHRFLHGRTEYGGRRRVLRWLIEAPHLELGSHTVGA
jgi:alpha-ketoglutarate-dependent taurine dioxygenase